jgi:very-short-patch-repair endonuclease
MPKEDFFKIKICEILQQHSININYQNDMIYVEADKLGKLLQITNMHTSMQNFLSDECVLIDIQTDGGIQKKTCLSEKGIKRILCSSRKPNSVILAKQLGITVTHKHVPLETSFIININKAFKGENIIFQYPMGSYYLDIYFPDYKLAIEFDEYRHKFYKNEDNSRQYYITSKLGCSFLRIKEGENIFESINKIFKKIKHNL